MARLHDVAPARVGRVTIGGDRLCLIAGPCLAESLELCRTVARHMVELSARLGVPYVFKASFDKANRSGANSVRGSGIDAGLTILASIKSEFNVPVTTDIHLPDHAAKVAEVVDMLQIPAFLSRQTDMIEAAAATRRPVNVKKGQFLSPSDCRNIVDKLRASRAEGILLTERGTSFGYNSLIVDMPGLEVMRGLGVPVCFDGTHSAQRPGSLGDVTGGARETIPAMCRAALAVGVDALFLEVHPDPARAASDASTQWPLADVERLLRQALEADSYWRD